MIVIPLHSWWRFRGTDRVALTEWLRIGINVDTVVFRFEGEKTTRKAKARSFLEAFSRVTAQDRSARRQRDVSGT